MRLCGHQAVSERQSFHPGHRQVAEHQLQRGEAADRTSTKSGTFHKNKKPNFLCCSVLATECVLSTSVMVSQHAALKHCRLCLQELAAIRDALTPPLACAAAKIGDIEALDALKDMVGLLPDCTPHTVCITFTAIFKQKDYTCSWHVLHYKLTLSVAISAVGAL